jgi:nucleotide-binding universal stress UspA family protein
MPPRSSAWLSETTRRIAVAGRGCAWRAVRGRGRVMEVRDGFVAMSTAEIPTIRGFTQAVGADRSTPKVVVAGAHGSRGFATTGNPMLLVQSERRSTVKILMGIDESPNSERAVEFVGRLRWPAGSRVIVVGALRPLTDLAASDLGSTPVPEQLLADTRRRLELVVERAREILCTAGISSEGRVLFGDPREVLLDVAKGEHADLLVVGSRGNTGLARLVLGSVSSHVVAHAPCSVLVVHRELHAAARGQKENV